MLAMVTAKDKKNLLEKGKTLAKTDETFLENLLVFQKGLDAGIVIGMARAGKKELPFRNCVPSE